jgi:hypothetical protein
VKSAKKYNLSHEIETDRLRTLMRRTEPDDLEAQVQALKELQQQPGFMAKRPVSKEKDIGYFKAFKNKWAHLVRKFFRR